MFRRLDLRRRLRWLWQRWTRGFDDRELWNLDVAIATFVLPRLKAFRNHGHGYPHDMTPETWDAALADMVYAFEFYSDPFTKDEAKKDFGRVDRGLAHFGERYGSLWV